MKKLFLEFNENNELVDMCLIDKEKVYYYQYDLIQKREFKMVEKKYIKDITLKILKKKSFDVSEEFFYHLLNNFNMYHISLTRIELIKLFPEIEEHLN